MSKMGTAYINKLNAEEDERQRLLRRVGTGQLTDAEANKLIHMERPSKHQEFIRSDTGKRHCDRRWPG